MFSRHSGIKASFLVTVLTVLAFESAGPGTVTPVAAASASAVLSTGVTTSMAVRPGQTAASAFTITAALAPSDPNTATFPSLKSLKLTGAAPGLARAVPSCRAKPSSSRFAEGDVCQSSVIGSGDISALLATGDTGYPKPIESKVSLYDGGGTNLRRVLAAVSFSEGAAAEPFGFAVTIRRRPAAMMITLPEVEHGEVTVQSLRLTFRKTTEVKGKRVRLTTVYCPPDGALALHGQASFYGSSDTVSSDTSERCNGASD